MKLTVQQRWPGGWKTVGTATTWSGAGRVARREYDPQGFGGFRHPDGGPKYGTLRAIEGDRVHVWDNALQTFL